MNISVSRSVLKFCLDVTDRQSPELGMFHILDAQYCTVVVSIFPTPVFAGMSGVRCQVSTQVSPTDRYSHIVSTVCNPYTVHGSHVRQFTYYLDTEDSKRIGQYIILK